VTDALSYQQGDAFGLTEFVDTLRAGTIHGMTPTVITAQFNPSPLAALSYDAATRHISNYKFTDAAHGLLKSRYDVFILSIYGVSGPKLTDEPVRSMPSRFHAGRWQAVRHGRSRRPRGGHVHGYPRVRNMRYWTNVAPQKAPSAGGIDRLTTNLPGRSDIPPNNDVYEFSDQSDEFPQRLYVNFRTASGGVGWAHPLLQVPGSNRAIEVFPDHPHEGECVIPDNLASKLVDGVTDEWPSSGGARVAPEMVALTMSHGNTFPGKEAVMPRSFIAICAYDGQATHVGRVVTDATWHHFVNINVKPGMSALAGRDLTDIKQYYNNLATWLMPKYFCRRFPWILTELVRYPLFEEISPIPRRELDGSRLRDIGALVERSLLYHHTRAEVKALIDDALEEAIGVDASRELEDRAQNIRAVSLYDVGLAARGSLTMATAERFNELKDKSEVDGEKAFAEVGKDATAAGVSST
jgi:hypothetical protein